MNEFEKMICLFEIATGQDNLKTAKTLPVYMAFQVFIINIINTFLELDPTPFFDISSTQYWT